LLGALIFVGAEIASFVVVAQRIGFFWAFAILIVVSALGPFLVRRVGVGALTHAQARLARGEVPTWELLDGVVVLIGGMMICVPGFISDAMGLALMVSPLRRAVIRVAGNALARRVQTIRVGAWNTMDVRPRRMDHASSPELEVPPRLGDPGDEIEPR